MKKVLVIILIMIIVLSLIGCIRKDEVNDKDVIIQTPNPTEEIVEQEETVDTVTAASIVDNGPDLQKALSADGAWIAATLNDIVIADDLIVDGQFENKDVVARKIALYTQDAEHNILDEFSLTAPKLIIRSENTKLQGGTFIGDIYVEADGFILNEAKVEGNVYYSNQNYMDSATIDQDSISGLEELKE